uniref:C2H2-type domain-containing protein n=1 Tax=Schistocephalus solidus TaxID=70667 RepID=A0A0V0J4D6_SCHSO
MTMDHVASTSGVRDYSCKVCSKTCNSLEQLRAHMSSRSHIRRCERSYSESGNMMDSLTYYAPNQVTPESGPSLQSCFACGDEMTSASLLSHQCPSSVIIGGSLEDLNSSECSFSHSSLSAQPVDSLPNSYFSGATSMLVGKERKSGPFDCLICNVTLNSTSQYEAHLQGKRHKSRATGENTSSSDANMSNCSITGRIECGPTERFCEVCCTTVQVANWALHVAGRTHNRKLSSGAVSLSLKHGPRGDVLSHITNGSFPGMQMCAVCDVPVSPENMAAHVAGRTHSWKFLINGGSTICTTNNEDSPQPAASVFRVERLFSSFFPLCASTDDRKRPKCSLIHGGR